MDDPSTLFLPYKIEFTSIIHQAQTLEILEVLFCFLRVCGFDRTNLLEFEVILNSEENRYNFEQPK